MNHRRRSRFSAADSPLLNVFVLPPHWFQPKYNYSSQTAGTRNGGRGWLMRRTSCFIRTLNRPNFCKCLQICIGSTWFYVGKGALITLFWLFNKLFLYVQRTSKDKLRKHLNILFPHYWSSFCYFNNRCIRDKRVTSALGWAISSFWKTTICFSISIDLDSYGY